MKNLTTLLCVVLCVLFAAGCSSPEKEKGYAVRDGMIVFDEPTRAPGQQSVLRLAVDPIPVVRVGFIGLGMRGPGAVDRFTHLEGVEIKALCDLIPERIEPIQQMLVDRGRPQAATYSGEEGWKELCERDDIDLIYLCTPWQLHVPMAVYAMEHGKHVAIEVPAAMSVAECWQLVDTSEKTQRHCMMLENCVYDFFELTTLNMAQQGLFGEILHVEGAYIHNLDEYWDLYQGNWRLDFNQSHRGDVYATHGLGPACQVLNIHRGDRMKYLVAMDTKSVCGLQQGKEKMKTETFANGDLTLTMIKTENDRSILLEHNVMTPRVYDRMYQVTGTNGLAEKYQEEGYLFRATTLPEGTIPNHENLAAHEFIPQADKEALMARYKHPIVANIEQKAREVGGHGGMDFIMDYRLIYCLQNGLPLDQDVYDAAEWSCIGELSAASIEHNSMPTAVPDFTRGDWKRIDGYRHAMAK